MFLRIISFSLIILFLITKSTIYGQNDFNPFGLDQRLFEISKIVRTDSTKGFEILRGLIKDTPAESARSQIYEVICKLYFDLRNYNAANHYLQLAIDAFISTNKLKNAALLCLYGAQKNREVRINRLAIKFYTDGIELAQKGHLTELETEGLESLGYVYWAFRNIPKAEINIKQALARKLKKGDEPSACLRICCNLADLYSQASMNDSALFYAEESIKWAKLTLDTEAVIQNKIIQSIALLRLHKTEEAKIEIEKLMTLANPLPTRLLDLDMLLVKGNYYLYKEDTISSQKYFEQAMILSQRMRRISLVEKVYRNMASAYQDKGYYKLANQYTSLYYESLIDTYAGEGNQRTGALDQTMKLDIAQLQVKNLTADINLKKMQLLREKDLLASSEKQKLLMSALLDKEKLLSEALNRENEIKNSELKQTAISKLAIERENTAKEIQLADEKKFKWILTSGIILLLISGAIITVQYRKQIFKNQLIQKQAADMEILMKEIHHRVKNNLQVISSLLDLQSNTLKDEQAVEAIKEGKNRVHSMALIHQYLYSEGNIKGIKVSDYINSLIESLYVSYRKNSDEIKITTSIDDLILDVDTVIPLGLVLNELISNSFKYAFKGRDKGEIHISLNRSAENLILKVKDDGQGLPPEMDKNSKSFGMKMIRAFSQKLKAKLKIYNDPGACIEMEFSKFKIAS